MVNSPVASPTEASPPVAGPPSPSNGRVLLILAVALAAGAVVGLFVFYPGSKPKGPAHTTARPTSPTPAAPAPAPAPAPAKVEEVPPPQPAPAPVVAPSEPPLAKRHVEITVQPAEASLFLDDHAVDSNQIKLDVEKARGTHVVEATAPGHIPYKKTLSFAKDVYLTIKLKKSDGPSAHAGPTLHSPQVVVQSPKNDGKNDNKADNKSDSKYEAKNDTKAAVTATPAEDFGMNLQRPALRRPTKKIDETDPYAP
jgi:hypothetical protein